LQTAFKDSGLDLQIGIFRDAENGPCEDCMELDEDWRERKVDDSVL